ncbi:DDX21 [Symbiodinium sp. CCMP2456]|nr:DDX21 [Symbiodinium sp. CCMP2456]
MSSSSSPSLARPFADLPHGATPPLSRRGEGHLLGGPLGSTGYPPRHVLTSPRKSPGDVRFGGPLGATMGAIYTPRQVLVSPRLTPRMPAGATSVIAYAPGLPSGFIPVAPAPKVSRPVEVAVRKQTPRFIRVSARSQERILPISREVTSAAPAAASAAAPAAAPAAATDGAAREVELEAFPKQADAASHVASPRSPHALAAPEVASPTGLEASPRDQLYHSPLAHAASDIQSSPMVRQRTLPGYLGQAVQSQMPPERQSSIAVITTITTPSYAVAVPRPSSVGRGSMGRALRAPELTSDRPPARAVGEALRADSRRRWRRPAPAHAPGTPGVAPHVPGAPMATARVHGPCHGRTSWSGTPPASAPVSAPPAQSRQGEGDFTPAFFRLQEKLSYLAEEGTVSL